MKISIEIPEEEIKKNVLDILCDCIADSVLTEGKMDYRRYNRLLKEATNAVLKERADEIIERCIPMAAGYIGRKGVKKMVEKMEKEGV